MDRGSQSVSQSDPSISVNRLVNLRDLRRRPADPQVAPAPPIKIEWRAVAADYKTAKRRCRPLSRRRTALVTARR